MTQTPSSSVPIAIVGMACLFPKAPTLGAFWQNLRTGQDAIGDVPPTHWSPASYHHDDPKTPDHTYAKRGGFLDPVAFRPKKWGIAPRDLEATDTTQLLGMVVAKNALDNAGYGEQGRAFDRTRVSVALGVTSTLELVIPLGARLGHPIWRQALDAAGIDQARADAIVESIAAAYVPWQENSFPGLLGNVAAGRIANRLDLQGSNCVVDAACASSLGALHLAVLELESNRADMVVAGGFDTFNDIFMYMCFSKTPALSPSGDARPFSAQGDGTILGEGLGALVLKRLDAATRDGDRIYAVIRGIGRSSDGKGQAIYAPSVHGQVRCLQDAYARADVAPRTIDLIEGHGTGTKVGDGIEVRALTEVFRADQAQGQWCTLGSVKSAIGHTKAAAGIAGVMKAALALHHRVLPPTLKAQAPHPLLAELQAPFRVHGLARPWIAHLEHPRRAGVSAFGFGGSNFHCVLEEHAASQPAIDWQGAPELMAVTADRFEDLADRLREFLQATTEPQVRTLCTLSRDRFASSAPFRLLGILTGAALDSWSATFERWLAHLNAWRPDPVVDDQALMALVPGELWLGRGPGNPDVAVLFPGQGAQAPNMLRDLLCRFPAAAGAFELLQVGGDFAQERLIDLVYPGQIDPEEAAQKLRRTDIAQAALGAVELAAWDVLRGFGLQPKAALGHSYGEVVALCAAGSLAREDFAGLTRVRGQAMAKSDLQRQGGMLALAAAREDVEQWIRENGLQVVVANHNASTQVVVAGSRAALDQAQACAKNAGMACKELAVGGAFHSPLMRAAAEPFARAVAHVDWNAPSFAVYANLDGQPYGSDPTACRRTLATHLLAPVEFVTALHNLWQSGVRTFVEVGPGRRLSALVRQTLGSAAQTLAIDGEDAGLALAQVLAPLAAAGHPIDLSAWRANAVEFAIDDGKDPTLGPVVWLSGANVQDTPQKAWPAALARAKTLAQSLAQPKVTAPPAIDVASPRPMDSRPANFPSAPMPHHPPALVPAATSQPTATPPTDFQRELLHTQSSMQALLTMAEQAAKVHQHFLASQEQALRGYQSLLARQQELVAAQHGVNLSAMPQDQASPWASGTREASPTASVTEASGLPRPTDTGGTATAPAASSAASFASPLRASGLSTLAPPRTINPTQVSPVPSSQPLAPPLRASDQASAPTATRSTRAPAHAQVQALLLQIVADKTGFPLDMLHPELTVDTDLGIDSIKRVEILAAVQEKITLAQPLRADELAALTRLADWIDRLAPAIEATTADGATTHEAPASDALAHSLLRIVADKTGFPPEMLSLDLSLESDLGIDSIKRVEIISALHEAHPEVGPLPAHAMAELHRLEDLVRVLQAHSPQQAQTNTELVAPAASESIPAKAAVSALAQHLLATVADKTGFPLDMLNLDMDLEADLGIDSIKRVEILASLRESRPFLPQLGADAVAQARTLNDWLAVLGDTALAVRAPQEPAQVPTPMPLATKVEVDAIAPADFADVDDQGPLLHWDVHATFAGPLTPLQAPVLASLPRGSTVAVLGARDDSLAAALAHALRQADFVVHLDEIEGTWPFERAAALFLVAPPWTLQADFVGQAMRRLQEFAPSQRGPTLDSSGLLVTVSLLDGRFGHSGQLDPALDVRQAGLWGLAKTAGLEWPHLAVRVFDLDPAWDDVAQMVAAVLAECDAQGPIERGLAASGKWHLTLAPVSPTTATPFVASEHFGAQDVVVISGGGRGVTAHVSARFARCGAHLAILGRTPAPFAESPAVQAARDEASLKKVLLEQAGGRLNPRELAVRTREVLANRELAANLRGFTQQGAASVRYFSVDIQDAPAVAQTMAVVQAELGPITVAVHGAGVLADRRIEDKTPADFERVWGAKVDGAASLLAALADAPLRAVLLFSSTTARFGRIGQVDYAAANCVLEAIAASLASRRPHCTCVAIGWGPWAGGMVTPALERVFANEGIGLVGLAAGANLALRELTRRTSPLVSLVLGPGSHLPITKPHHEKPQVTANLESTDPAAHESTEHANNHARLSFVEQGAHEVVHNEEADAVAEPAAPGKTEAGESPNMRTVLQRAVDLAREPNLRGHVLGGRAVLPAALMAEWMASAAAHGNPGLYVVGLDAFQVYRSLHLKGQEAVDTRLRVGRLDRSKQVLKTTCELESGNDSLLKRVLHAKATVLLSPQAFGQLDAAERLPSLRATHGWRMEHHELYSNVLFHGREYQILDHVNGCDNQSDVLEAELRHTPVPAQWSPEPLREQWLLDPLALDAAFQLAIVWCVRNTQQASLPTGFGALRQLGVPWPREGLRLRMRMRRKALHRVIADFEWLTRQGTLVAVMRDYACVTDASLKNAFAARELIETSAHP